MLKRDIKLIPNCFTISEESEGLILSDNIFNCANHNCFNKRVPLFACLVVYLFELLFKKDEIIERLAWLVVDAHRYFEHFESFSISISQ